MIGKYPNDRRRRAGAIAAICGGSAAGVATLGRHATSSGADGGLVWQDAGIAVAVVLIIVALVTRVVAARCR